MKFELEVVRFDVEDVITGSGTTCANPSLPSPLGNKIVDCTGVV